MANARIEALRQCRTVETWQEEERYGILFTGSNRFDPAVILAVAAIALLTGGTAHAQIAAFSVGADNPTTYPAGLASFPDEHVTFMYYSTATNLALQGWSKPQLIAGSLHSFTSCTRSDGGNSHSFDGFYPSMMSPGALPGHVHNTGRIYFLSGCQAASHRKFDYREFNISTTTP
jgi:hypothetical protein